MANIPITTFNGGEYSPLIDTRIDTEKYVSGCRILENMLPRVYGCASRRPGTKYVATARNSPESIRLIAFIYNSEIAYICEFGDLYIRFYYAGEPLMYLGSHVEIASPYLVADLPALQIKQLADVMWITHPDYAPRKLTRTTAYTFALTQITFNDGPFLPRNDLFNDDGVTMDTNVVVLGNSGTLTASSAYFDDDHIGGLFKLVHAKDVTKVTLSTAGTATSTAIDIKGTFRVVSHGSWTGTLRLQRKDNDNSFEDWRTYTSGNPPDVNVSESFVEDEDNIQYQMIGTITGGTINAEIVSLEPLQESIYRVDSITSSLVANVTVLKAPPATNGLVATLRWSEGSWSSYRGFPAAITFINDRCVYGGTTHQPGTVWLSETGDYENFEEGVKDADSFKIPLMTTNEIRWLNTLDALVVGTSGDEWRISSNKLDTPLSPTNYVAKVQSNWGSNELQSIRVNDALLFTDYTSAKLREIVDGGAEKYNTFNMSALAEHITLPDGIGAMAFQKTPEPILWSVRNDGTLLSMNYDKEQNAIAWARHLSGITQVESTEIDTEVSSPPVYPTLQALTSAEIPTKPTEVTDTALSGATTFTQADAATMRATIAGTPAGHYTLGGDIDLTGVSWTPIAGFSGVFDGGGYTISNLTINLPSTSYVAMFSYLGTGAEIRNLNFSNCSITGKVFIAVLLAGNGFANKFDNLVFKDITFTDCTLASGDNHTGTTYAGCLIGSTYSGDCNIWRCTTSNCNITLNDNSNPPAAYGGMLIADLRGSTWDGTINVVDCHSTGGTIRGAAGGAGLIAVIQGQDLYWVNIYDCYSSSAILEDRATVTYCIDSSGGLIGSTYYANITNCYATGSISTTDDHPEWATEIARTGGLIGIISDSVVTNCYATGNISGAFMSSTGGFVGSLRAGYTTITRCYATGSLTARGSVLGSQLSVGGFIGLMEVDHSDTSPTIIERCSSTGDVTIAQIAQQDATGGFIGRLYVKAHSDSSTTEDFIIRNCYSWGSVDVEPSTIDGSGTGGFIGRYQSDYDIANAKIQNCYDAQTEVATGSGLTNQVNGDTDVGGFQGEQYWAGVLTIESSFWDTETSGQSTSVAGTGGTTAELMTQSTYETAGWDFDTIWMMERTVNYIHNEATGVVVTVATIPSTTEDEVWVGVRRNINGSLVMFIEQMQPQYFENQEDCYFVDCGRVYDYTTGHSNLGGLTHLEGEEVCIFADGAGYPNQVVTGGEVVLSNIVYKGAVGLPFRYKVKPMRIVIGNSSMGLNTKISRLILIFQRTLDAQYGNSMDNLYDIKWRTEEVYDSPPALFSGDKEVTFDGGFDSENPILITGIEPLPCTIKAIIARLDVTGR